MRRPPGPGEHDCALCNARMTALSNGRVLVLVNKGPSIVCYPCYEKRMQAAREAKTP